MWCNAQGVLAGAAGAPPRHPSITKSPEPRIGVCLSGGGFRASFYALGVLRYLAEAGLLRLVVAIPAVSGGSIAAAAVAGRADQLAGGGSATYRFARAG